MKELFELSRIFRNTVSTRAAISVFKCSRYFSTRKLKMENASVNTLLSLEKEFFMMASQRQPFKMYKILA